MDRKKEEENKEAEEELEGVRECVFMCGIRQDGLPNPTGNLSLSQRGGKIKGVRREGKERGRERMG